MSVNSNFASTPQSGVVLINSANTNRDGTGTLGTVVTAGANGSRVEWAQIEATGTTTQGMIRFYLHNGTSAFLIKEVQVTPIVPSGTVQSFSNTVTFGNAYQPFLLLPNGFSLRVSTNNAEAFHITSVGGSF